MKVVNKVVVLGIALELLFDSGDRWYNLSLLLNSIVGLNPKLLQKAQESKDPTNENGFFIGFCVRLTVFFNRYELSLLLSLM